MGIKKVTAAKVEAAGILYYARDTGNFLLVYRGEDVVDPNCWCGAGGKIEEGETPEEAARREIFEEIGFDTYENEGTYTDLYTYESDELKFYNFLGVVETQFFPELNWESYGYMWVPLEHFPAPLHYGLQAILNDAQARDVIRDNCDVEMPDRFVGADLREDLTADADEMPNNDYSAIPHGDELVKAKGEGDVDEGDVPYRVNPETKKTEQVNANLKALINLEVDRRLGLLTQR